MVSTPDLIVELTETELEVLQLVAAGRQNKQIARARTSSEQTIKNVVSRLLTKSGCDNRTELTAAYHSHRITFVLYGSV